MVRLRVLEILAEQNHTKYWLFKQMETTYTSFHKMINNQTKSIHYETLDKLSTILGCSVGDLFEKVETPHQSLETEEFNLLEEYTHPF